MRRCRVFAVVLFAVASISAPASAVAQGRGLPNSPAGFPQGPKLGRTLVDGSRKPELIPDRVAVAMFLTAIAIPATADQKSVLSMEAKVRRMQLSRPDMAVLRAELSGLHARLQVQKGVIDAAYLAARRERTPQADARAVAAREGRYAMTWDSYTRLRQTLSPAGTRQLITQIARVKTQTKTLGRSGR